MKKLLGPLVSLLALVTIMLLCFAGTAFAADAVAPPDASLQDLAAPVYNAIAAGHYLAATALALVLTVALVKRYAGTGKVGTFVHSDVGGALTTLAMAFFGAIATATAAGATWHWSMLGTAGLVAFTAAGGYALVKKLVIPLLKKLEPKLPAWTAPIFALVFFVFDKPDAIEQATKAGDDAIRATPATGADGVTGKPTDVA